MLIIAIYSFLLILLVSPLTVAIASSMTSQFDIRNVVRGDLPNLMAVIDSTELFPSDMLHGMIGG
jgi:hypothetical protein